MSQRNRGIYEPEFRLILAQTMLFGVFGYIGWAIGNDHQMPWIGAVACIVYVPPLLQKFAHSGPSSRIPPTLHRHPNPILYPPPAPRVAIVWYRI